MSTEESRITTACINLAFYWGFTEAFRTPGARHASIVLNLVTPQILACGLIAAQVVIWQAIPNGSDKATVVFRRI